MAKGKKKENLTPEERLQAALVPDWEQPYKVPENWCWTTQNTVATFLNGRAYKQNELLEDDTKTPILRVGNLFTNSSWYYSNLELDSDKYIDNGDLIYAWSASFGPFIWAGNKVIYHYHIWKVILSSAVQKKYMYFWLLYDKERLKQGGHGTGMIHVTKAMIEAAFIPLPPLSEQQRIVDRIESLFAKLDEAKQKAQDALDSFETRKAAILHKAFTGELTAQWRKEHGVGMESWEKKELGNVTEILSSKRIYKEEYTANGIPFFRSSEVVDLYDTGNTEPTFFISEQRYEEIKSQYGVPDVGDLLVTSVGTIGKTWIVDDRKFYYKDGNLTQVRKNKLLDMRFLQFYIMSAEFKEQIEDTVSGSAYNALTIVKFKKIRLPIPSVIEQTEIVRILDDFIAKEQQAKEAAEAVLEQIDLIKKSILARAFRGELGTNDPAEESAEELLFSKI